MAGHGLLSVDGAGVEASLHAHDAHPRLLEAVHEGALDRGSPPVAGKQRCVHVDGCPFRNVEHGLGQDHAVGGNDQKVGSKGLQQGDSFSLGLGRTQGGRLEDGQPLLERQLLDRRGRQLSASSRSLVGLGPAGRHLDVRRIQQTLQDVRGKGRRAHEDDA